MYQCHAKCLLTVIFLLGGINTFAQTGTTSNPTNGRENNPYSRFGIGEFWNGNNTVLRGMGNVTSAFENPYEVNTDNPASYSFIKRTTFEMGGMASTRTLKSADLSYTTGTASIAYLNIAVPVSKNAGICFGFKPYTRAYYNLIDTLPNDPAGTASGRLVRSYNGDGGLNNAFIGAAAKFKGLSIGFNFGYMFGTYTNNTVVSPIDSTTYTAVYTNYNRIGGVYWKGGFMYETKLDSSLTLNIGGTVNIGQNLKEKFNAYQISIFNFGDTLVSDTVSNPGELRGNLKLPLSYSIGVMLGKRDKWSIGLDYAATQWSDYSSSPNIYMNKNVGSQSYKMSIGGEYTPDINNIRSYFARVTYRLGAYYGIDYLKINNNEIPYYGFTAGGSLPFRRSLSHMHLAIDAGRLGSTSNNMIQQNYVRFTVGFSFNDLWFIRPKYQ